MKTTLQRKPNAFSLVELLMVLTIISIMAALIINAFSNASQDSRDVISRQQQAVLKSALDNAISQVMVKGKTVGQARKYYNYKNGTSGAQRTMLERLQILEPYLDEDTFTHFTSNSTASKIRSAAMAKTGQYIEFEFWEAPTASVRNTYPKVKLSSD